MKQELCKKIQQITEQNLMYIEAHKEKGNYVIDYLATSSRAAWVTVIMCLSFWLFQLLANTGSAFLIHSLSAGIIPHVFLTHFRGFGPDLFDFRKTIRILPGVIIKISGFWQIDNINILYFRHRNPE